MSAILRVKDAQGQWIDIPSIIGRTGVSITGVTLIGTTGDETTGTIDTYRIDYSDETSSTFQIKNGAKGDSGEQGPSGPSGNIDIVTATTLNSGENATVTKEVDQQTGQITLNFGIPKGSVSATFIDWGDDV